MATFSIQLPNVKQLDWNDRRTQSILLDFFNELTEKLNYSLNNLDTGNFDKTTYIDLSKAISNEGAESLVNQLAESEEGEREALFSKLKDLIIQTAYDITQEYTAEINTTNESLESVYEFLFTGISQDGTLQQQLSTVLSQTAEQISATASDIEEITTDINGKLETFKSEVTSYLTFDATNGLTIGKEGSQFTTVIDNTRLSFKQAGTTVAYIQNNKMVIPNAEITELTAENISASKSITTADLSVTGNFEMGPLEWVSESNGSYSLRKRS